MIKKERGLIGAIANHKGGTGKTVATVNLSAALAIQGQKILVIDNDPQSDSTKALIQDTNFDDCLYELLDPENNEVPPIKNCIYPTIHENLYIIPNITDTSWLEIPLAKGFPETNTTMRDRLHDYVKDHYDYAFIDCSPTLSVFVSNALHCADFVIVPMMAGSGNSLDGVQGVLRLMEMVRTEGNPELKLLKILVNKIDRRITAHKANLLNAQEKFGKEDIFKATIPTSAHFEATEMIKRSTVFKSASNSKGAVAFRNLAKEFLQFFENKR